MTREQRRAADPAVSAWVSASAGTGKTHVLTNRVLRLLLDGTPPARLLCLTFTKAAAAEMATRVFAVLGGWARCSQEQLLAALSRLTGGPVGDDQTARARRLFAEALETPGGLKIQTIHAFCQGLLNRFPLEAGVAPHFQVLDERTAQDYLAQAMEQVLARARDGDEGGLSAALTEISRHSTEVSFHELMRELMGERGRLARMIEGHDGDAGRAVAALRRRLGVTTDEPEIIAAACAAVDNGLAEAVAALVGGSKTDRERGAALTAWLNADPEMRAAGFWDYAKIFLANELTTIRKTLITQGPAQKHPAAAQALAREAERLCAIIGEIRLARVARASAALIHFGAALLEDYKALKARHGVLDYDDLILHSRDLLARPGIAPWVLYKLDGGLDHILIDEAQDTNPEQWQVIEALAEEFFAGAGARETRRTIFAVGDAKQSIFSFQRADPAGFERSRRLFQRRVAAVRGGFCDVVLDLSFRSTQTVLEAVDAVFANDAARAGLDESGAPVRHVAHRLGHAGRVELWPVEKPDKDAPATPWRPPLRQHAGADPEARLARRIARRIKHWLTTGERLAARDRAVRPGDIMVLVRRRTPFVDVLVRALKQLRVPVAGADRMVLDEQLAVMDLMALGRFSLLPEDDLTLAVVLKGPFVGLDEEALFALAHGRDKSLWRTLAERAAQTPAYAAAWLFLSGLLARADYCPPYEFFAHLLEHGDGRKKLLARLGHEANDPIDEFLAQALAFERVNPPSLQGFLHWLEAGEAQIKRDMEQGRNEVRVMTVHGAKGLQAPIVILPDTCQVPEKMPRSLWLEGDGAPLLAWPPGAQNRVGPCAQVHESRRRARDEEYRRLLYVALTRSEDRLYITGWDTKNKRPAGCWYNLIEAGLKGLPGAAADDPEFGEVWRLEGAQSTSAKSDQQAETVPPTEAPLPDWAGREAPEEPRPSRPLNPSRPDEAEPAARSPLYPPGEARFHRGRLIHRLLQSLPDLPHEARAEAARRFLAQPVHGLTQGDIAPLVAEVMAVLDDDTFAPLFGPHSRAEAPLVGIAGGMVVSGQVDRLAVGEREVLVVDYKTNRPPPATPEQTPAVYLRQMGLSRYSAPDLSQAWGALRPVVDRRGAADAA